MIAVRRYVAVSMVCVLLLGSTAYLTSPGYVPSRQTEGLDVVSPAALFSDQYPLSRIAFVASDPLSYVDEYAYIATVPTGVFVHNNTQYISPVLYSSDSTSEAWLVEDWAEYLYVDGGLEQGIVVGDYPESLLLDRQESLGSRIYPRIDGATAAEIAAKLAASEWASSASVVVAIAEDDFTTPSPITGSASHTIADSASSEVQFSGSAVFNAETSNPFTPPSWAVWMYGRFNWSTTSEVLTHRLVDPNGNILDYSRIGQMAISRDVNSVEILQPMQFWLPVTVPGQWIMNVTNHGFDTVPLDCKVTYHPGFRQPVTVPAGAASFEVTLNWNNVATDLNLALIDPTGRMAMWAPAGSILSSPGVERINLPYPMPGEWTIIAGWMDATTEQNGLQLQWEISFLPTDLSENLEAAANAGVLASLRNAPLLYVDGDQVPAETQWALSRLGATQIFLVDPLGFASPSLLSELGALGSLIHIDNYPSVVGNITSISKSPDIVVTAPLGSGNELFAPSTYSAAVHGAPLFSVCGGDNELTTRAQETWAPYLVGPEIDNIYVVNRYENRAENGWYDERIPNQFSMMESVDTFEAFLGVRGAYNASTPQPVVVVAPETLVPSSFDRSLQSHFNPGRIPAATAEMASVFINRGLLHRYLFLTADSANTSLVSMYAYTDGEYFLDNFYNYPLLTQIENTTDALEDVGLETELHVGADVLFSYLDSQVAFWSLSTHGTLTLLPRDPPSRPGGQGHFSLRSTDSPWGFEESEVVRESLADGDHLVNPVAYAAENQNHVTRSTDDLDAALGNIGSPIVILTACLLGGTRLPEALMEHGAVAVTGSPRTVYFRPAGMLSVLVAQSLCEGETIGASLSNGLKLVSWDYSDPLTTREPADYANQQILFGDPSVRLYVPSANPHVAAVNPASVAFDGHTPGRGTSPVAALGQTAYLPAALSVLGISYDYYEPSNMSEFLTLLSLRSVTIVEPGTVSSFASELASSSEEIEDYVKSGGVLAILGIDDSLPWLPWPMVHSASGSGSSVSITEASHPLLSSPNSISSAIDYNGHFVSVWSNLTILATDGSDPVLVAGLAGLGKVALSTLTPTGSLRDELVENIVSWMDVPSIYLRDIALNQVIIWAGDTVRITIELTDIVGNPIQSASVDFWLNASSVSVTEVGEGIYSVILGGNWTQSNIGEFDIRIQASLAGFDTLSLVLEDFLTVRAVPWLIIAAVGGVLGVGIVGYLYLRRRRGDKVPWKDDRRSKEEREQQRKEDSKVDAKEFFGV